MKFIRSKYFFVAAASLSLFGCAGRPFTPPYSQTVETAKAAGQTLPSIDEARAKFLESDTANQDRLVSLIQARGNERRGTDSSYHLGAGDTIQVSVFDVPELNVTTQVLESGFVSLPLIGAVQASGKTATSMASDLRGRLSAFVRSPQVSLTVTEYGSQKISVLGAVANPGAYPLKKGSNTVAELLGLAGGVNARAGNYINFIPGEQSGLGADSDPAARARFALSTDGHPSAGAGIEIYLDQILGTAGAIPVDVPVRAGDMLIVPEAGKVTVEGEVQKIGSYDLGQQMTMLGALAAAGGVTFGAKVDEVEIVREVGLNDKSRLIVDLTKVATGEQKNVRLKNGDIVRVPSDTQRRFRQDTYELVGRVINFGVGGQLNVLP